MGNGSSKHGDAIGDKLRDRFARNRAERRRARERLESLPDDEDITAEDILEAVKVGAAAATTGKHHAMPAHDDHKPNSEKPSDPPKPVRGVVAIIRAVNNPYALGALALLVVALFVWLRFGR